MIPLKDDNPSRHFPIVNTILIILNIVVFIFQLTGQMRNQELVFKYSLIPSLFFSDPLTNWYRPITYVFLHGGFMHIIGNMLFLYIFGDNIEDILGHVRYIFFFFLSGICGGLLQAAFSAHSSIPIIGASGAISGVITAYMILFPLKKILTLIFLGFFILPVKIPAFFYIAVWIIIQFYNGLFSITNIGDKGGVAYLVHVGGILFGFFYILLRKRKLQQRYDNG